jgi:proton glutamate symport protein
MALKSRTLPVAFFVLVFLAGIFHLLDYTGWLVLPGLILPVSRWIVIAVMLVIVAKKRSLTPWILAGLVAGVEFGHDLPAIAVHLEVVSLIFLRLIKTLVGPLLFGTLVVGIAGHSNFRQIGRMGWKSILYFEIVTTVAIFLGLLAINLSKAGIGIHLPDVAGAGDLKAPTPQSAKDLILHVFPENVAKALAEGNILQVVVFSILFGIGTALTAEKFRLPMVRFAESLSEVMFKFTHIVMYVAPVAVFAAVAFTVGQMGLGIMHRLMILLVTLYVTLGVFLLFVLFPVCLIFRIPVVKFIKAVIEPASVAFSTSSSEAALPVAMEQMQLFGVPQKIVAFVIPLGYSFNLDGSSIYLALASVFVAQAAGIDLPIGTQIAMMFTLMLTSKGVAGVSRAALVILLGTVSSFGLPTLPVFVLLGVDAIMDMGRTAVNVIGNCLASVVIARSERELNLQ